MIDFLEGHIDPFDLDVFTPHLNSNLNRLVQRTSVSSRHREGAGSKTPSEGQLHKLLNA